MKVGGISVVVLSSMAVGAAAGAIAAMNLPVVRKLYKKGLHKAKMMKLL